MQHVNLLEYLSQQNVNISQVVDFSKIDKVSEATCVRPINQFSKNYYNYVEIITESVAETISLKNSHFYKAESPVSFNNVLKENYCGIENLQLPYVVLNASSASSKDLGFEQLNGQMQVTMYSNGLSGECILTMIHNLQLNRLYLLIKKDFGVYLLNDKSLIEQMHKQNLQITVMICTDVQDISTVYKSFEDVNCPCAIDTRSMRII